MRQGGGEAGDDAEAEILTERKFLHHIGGLVRPHVEIADGQKLLPRRHHKGENPRFIGSADPGQKPEHEKRAGGIRGPG